MARTKETAKLELSAYLTSMSFEGGLTQDKFIEEAYACGGAKGLTLEEVSNVIRKWAAEIRVSQGVS